LVVLGFLYEAVRSGVRGVWPQNPFFQVLETIWRIQLTAGHLDPDASARDQEAINPVPGGGKLGVAGREALFVPEVNARLVSSFHADPEIASEGIDALDRRVFRIPGQVAVVEVENVVVLDPPISSLPGRAVPGCLEEAASCDVALAGGQGTSGGTGVRHSLGSTAHNG
jgi:hypothetical protein